MEYCECLTRFVHLKNKVNESCETFAIFHFRFLNVPHISFTFKQKCVTVVIFQSRPSGAHRNVYHAGALPHGARPRGKRYGSSWRNARRNHGKTRGILSCPILGRQKLRDIRFAAKSVASNRVTVAMFHGESSPRSQFRVPLSKNFVTFMCLDKSSPKSGTAW